MKLLRDLIANFINLSYTCLFRSLF